MKLANCFLLLSLVATAIPAGAAEPAASPATNALSHDEKMKWFRDAKFGLFIHWGVYSVPAGEWKGKSIPGIGEWIMNRAEIPVKEYEQLAKKFKPRKFDAEDWVQMAEDAGMKYIVITSKHHDGFGMYQSDQTDWCIKSTPFKRDPLKELAGACKEQGIKLCFYHSIMDWHHPDYLPRRPWEKNVRPATGADPERYFKYMKAELAELVQNYGPLGVLWFDGEWEATWTHEQGKALYSANCARCHGVSGKGDGPDSASAPKPPVDLTDQAFMAQKSAEDFFQVISNGLPPTMPAFVTKLSDDERWMLATYLRSLTFT